MRSYIGETAVPVLPSQMEELLKKCSKDGRTVLSVKIVDIGGGGATLYVLNGGIRPPVPLAGDFSYDFSESSISVYDKNWWIFTVNEAKSLIWHPNGTPSVVSFTSSGLPYWTPSNQSRCGFDNTDAILSHFRATFDANKFEVIVLPTAHSESWRHTSILRSWELIMTQKEIWQRKSLYKVAESIEHKSRFVRSSMGFPEGSETLRWDGGYETYVPFAGKWCKEDRERLLVNELARRASQERSEAKRCGPEPEAFRVNDLIVELELDPVLKAPNEHGDQVVETVWKETTEKIRKHIGQSTSVVVRGWSSMSRTRFSKTLMSLQFGNLGQGCQWVDGVLFAKARECEEETGFHEMTTLNRFVDLVEDLNTCGNFLDSKDVNPCPPMWIAPLLDSTVAWNQTMHLRFAQKATKSKKRGPAVDIELKEPWVVRSATWTSQGWRLVTHPGFVTFPHHDCCGMCTYVIGNSGAKIWGVIRPKRDICPTSLQGLSDILYRAVTLSPDGCFSQGDVATVCLEEGDIMFQPPGVLHSVYTPVPSIFSGGYFYHYETMHLTRAVLSIASVDDGDSLTNDHRPGYLRTLCRMLIALRYRSETRMIGKRSLLSLLLMILDRGNRSNDGPSAKDTSGLADEERGEIAFAISTAEHLLRWLNLTVKNARNFVDSSGPYYLGGDEHVEIPALMEGQRDLIFPDMNGFL